MHQRFIKRTTCLSLYCGSLLFMPPLALADHGTDHSSHGSAPHRHEHGGGNCRQAQ